MIAEFKNFVRILLEVPNFHRSELLVTFGNTKVTEKGSKKVTKRDFTFKNTNNVLWIK